jgi:hypothetical protein
MAMTNKELGKLDREKLTQAQQTALRLVENGRWEDFVRFSMQKEKGCDRDTHSPLQVLLGSCFT